MKLLAVLVFLPGIACAQAVGTITNVLFSGNNNLSPTTQEILVTADGSTIAVTASLTTIADVVVTNMSSTGSVVSQTNILFPGSNDVHATNRALVASRDSHFFCCYGGNGTVGDLVFIARNASGTWTATNVLFPSSNDVPSVNTKPAISDDEQFIVCRGLTAIADIVIIPVNFAAGVFSPGTAFNEGVPGGNSIPLTFVDPVIAPNSFSFAIAGTNSAIGDLVIGTVGRPVTSGNTTLVNVLFPSNNNLYTLTVPPAVSPTSSYYAVHGSSGTIGDLVVIAMTPLGVVGTLTNALWPLNNNTASTGVPPSVSGDGRIVVVNGSDSVNGDVVVLPIDPTGIPGMPANGAFPASNNVANIAIPPVVSSDAILSVQRGSATIGDLVGIRLTFTGPTTFTGTMQNILYPASNNVPDVNAGVALAPDRSYAVTLGAGTIGDIVITPFDGTGAAQTPINVLYPASNNVANLGTTPRISREGLLILTSGSPTIGDAVLTGVEPNPTTGFIQNLFTSNLLYPAANDNTPTSREPVFSPTTQFFVTGGSPTIGDLVVAPLLDPFPRFRARGDIGTTVPVRLIAPGSAGKTVFGAAAFGRFPGIVLPPPDGRTFPLNADPLFVLSTDPANVFFMGFVGTLDVNGVWDGGVVNLPLIPALEGGYFYMAYVVFDPAGPIGLGTISRASVFPIE